MLNCETLIIIIPWSCSLSGPLPRDPVHKVLKSQSVLYFDTTVVEMGTSYSQQLFGTCLKIEHCSLVEIQGQEWNHV